MSDVILTFGNSSPHQSPRGDVAVSTGEAPDPESMVRLDSTMSSITTVVVPEDTSLDRMLLNIQQLWPHHSSGPPTWVIVDSDLPPAEIDAIAAQVRRAMGIPEPPAGPVALATNGGIDFVATQMAGSASATAVAKWVGLTANSSVPAAGDTTLTGEIATAGGGLIRVAATFAHTPGATTYTLTNTYTTNGNDVLPVTIAKVGCFNASTVGTMVFETLLNATATLSLVGDAMPLTWTFTL